MSHNPSTAVQAAIHYYAASKGGKWISVTRLWQQKWAEEISEDEIIEAAEAGLIDYNGESFRSPKAANFSVEESLKPFYAKYQGRKSGIKLLVERLRKHADWKDVIPLLLPALESQIGGRKAKYIKGEFIPPWPDMTTWINQRRWEWVEAAPDAETVEDLSNAPEFYREYLLKHEQTCPTFERLTLAQLTAYKAGDVPFKGLKNRLSAERLAFVFWNSHQSKGTYAALVRNLTSQQ